MKRRSSEHCARISAKLKGRVFTLEWRSKLSAAQTGKVASDEARAAMRAGAYRRYGTSPNSPKRKPKPDLLPALAEEAGLSLLCLKRRLKEGMTLEQATHAPRGSYLAPYRDEAIQ